MIFHIDADSFYASCEQVFRPDLYNKPIAVLSNNDGIIISLNKQCKLLGFHRGDPYFKMKESYKSSKVTVFSSNYTLYADISRRINLIYNTFCPDVEQYSIDESFLNFPDWKNGNYRELGHMIRNEVKRQIHVPVSVGIAPTKTLAKMCNKLAKTYGGVCDWNEIDQEQTLKDYAVADLWGVGKSKQALLIRNGIKTAYDLKNFPLDRAKKNLTITGFRTVRELNGISSIEFLDSPNRQNITVSRSSAREITSIQEIEAAVSEYTQLAVTRMRQENSACRIVSVTLMTARAYEVKNKDKEYYNSAAAQLPSHSSYLPDILNVALALARSIFREGYLFRKVMVNLLLLEPDCIQQRELFQTGQEDFSAKKQAIMNACDTICNKYGRNTLHIGVRNQIKDLETDGKQAAWIMKRELLSPEYTTSWADIPGVTR